MKGINDVNFKYIISEKDLKPLCEKIDVECKKKIINVFDGLKPTMYTSSYIYDVMLGKETELPILGYVLGEYGIDSRDIYYFKKYDLKLNDDFIDYVLSL